MKDLIKTMSENPAIKPRDIAITLHKRYPEAVFTDRDINNYRQKLRRDSLDSYSSTQAAVKLLREKGVFHLIKYKNDDETSCITSLFFAFPWQLEI